MSKKSKITSSASPSSSPSLSQELIQARALNTNDSNRVELFGRLTTSTPIVDTANQIVNVRLEPVLVELAELREMSIIQNRVIEEISNTVKNGFSAAENNHAIALQTLKNFRKDCMGAFHDLSAQLEETRSKCRLDTLDGIIVCITQLVVFLWRFLIILKQILVFIHYSAMAWADLAGICPIIGQWATSGIKLLIYLIESLIITLMLNAIGILFGIPTLGETALQKMAYIFCEVISHIIKLFYNMSMLLMRVPNALLSGFTQSTLGSKLEQIQQELMTWLFNLYTSILNDVIAVVYEKAKAKMSWFGGNNLDAMPDKTIKKLPKLSRKLYKIRGKKTKSSPNLKLGLYGATTNDNTLTFDKFIKKYDIHDSSNDNTLTFDNFIKKYNIHDSSKKIVKYINTLKKDTKINLLKKSSESEINTYTNFFKIINNGVNTVNVTTFCIFDLIIKIFENFEKIKKVELVNSDLDSLKNIPEVRNILCNFII